MQAFLAVVIQTPQWYTLLCSGTTMNAVYLTNQIHYEHIKLLLVTFKGIVTSQVTVFLHCYMCTSHGVIFRN